MQTFNPDNCLKAHFSSPSARLATLLFRFLLVILHILHLNVFGKLRIMRIFYFSTSCLPLKSNKYRIKYKINEFPADYNCTLPNNRQYFSLFYLNCTKLFNQICFSCLREELKVFPIRIRFKKTFAVSCFCDLRNAERFFDECGGMQRQLELFGVYCRVGQLFNGISYF